MARGESRHIEEHLNGNLQKQDEVQVPTGRVLDDEEPSNTLVFNREQMRLEENINKRLDQALQSKSATEETEVERLLALIEENGSMLFGSGTGKTAVLDRCIRRAVSKGANVLVALPTGAQGARMRQKHPRGHGHVPWHLHVPQAIDGSNGRTFQQTQGNVAGSRKSPLPYICWAHAAELGASSIWRQDQAGDPLLAKLHFLKKNKPMGTEGQKFIRDLCRNHKAWSGHHQPTNLDIQDLLRKTENKTTIITCTKRAAALVNRFAVELLFEVIGADIMGEVPTDYEGNQDNYD
eukprot:448008-Amphidinium_carterae.3